MRPPSRKDLRRSIVIALRIGLPALVLWLVWGELASIDWVQVRAEIQRSHAGVLLVAVCVVALNVAVMGLYDAFSFPRAASLRFQKRWAIGCLCFSWSNFLTIGPFGGPALRFAVYRRYGLEIGSIARGLALQYVGFASGLVAWLAAAALPIGGSPIEGVIRPLCALIGALALSVVILLGWRAAVAWLRRDASLLESIRWRQCMALGCVGFLDWGCTVLAFSLVAFGIGVPLDPALAIGSFLGGHVVGMISMLPGGMGSADATWLLALAESGIEADQAAAIIVVFRAVFYLLPWALAAMVTILLLGNRVNDIRLWRLRTLAASASVFACFLLTVTALPEVGRQVLVPIGQPSVWVIEISHLATVLAAAALLMIAPLLRFGSRRVGLTAAMLLAVCASAQAITERDQLETVLTAAMLGFLGIAWWRSRPWDAPPLARDWKWRPPLIGMSAIVIHLLAAALALPPGRFEAFVLTEYTLQLDGSRLLRSTIVMTLLVVLALIAAWRTDTPAMAAKQGPTPRPATPPPGTTCPRASRGSRRRRSTRG